MAVVDKTIGSNPVSSVPWAKHQKPLPDPFSREEAEAILADMAAHYPQPIANYMEFKFFTGLRTSESFGLQWRNVDFATKHFVVSQTIVRGIEKENTKTDTARQVMLMAGMTPAFCAKQLGHSVEMFLRTYSKWLDGGQNALEMRRLEAALDMSSSLKHPQKR